MHPSRSRPPVVRTVRCEECGRAWHNPSERWRAYLTTDYLPKVVPYCPDCAEREFGGR